MPTAQSEQPLVTWTSPARPYKTRTREFYTTILSIAFLLGVILLLLKEFLLIGVIMAFAFLSYVLATHKPENINHEISEKGIITDTKLYDWNTFTHYWIERKYNQDVMIIKTKNTIPGIILMVIDAKKKKAIIDHVTKYLPLDKPVDNFVTRASSWLSDKVPLENT